MSFQSEASSDKSRQSTTAPLVTRGPHAGPVPVPRAGTATPLAPWHGIARASPDSQPGLGSALPLSDKRIVPKPSQFQSFPCLLAVSTRLVWVLIDRCQPAVRLACGGTAHGAHAALLCFSQWLRGFFFFFFKQQTTCFEYQFSSLDLRNKGIWKHFHPGFLGTDEHQEPANQAERGTFVHTSLLGYLMALS